MTHVLAGLAGLAVLAGCSGSEPSGPSAGSRVARIAVIPGVLAGDSALFPGDSVHLQPVAYDSAGNTLSGVHFAWGSVDTSVARVSPSGDVRALRAGQTNITVSANGHAEWIGVQVRARVASIALPSSEFGAVPHAVFRIEWTLLDSAGAPLARRPVTVASSAPGVATLDTSGVVQTGAPGVATLTVSREGRTATATVSVQTVRFTELTVGTTHACALDGAGQAWCWGRWPDSTRESLGVGIRQFAVPWPMRVVGAPPFSALSAGRNHTCGVSTSGQVYCWGRNTGVSHYQSPATLPDTARPTPIAGASGFTTVATGWTHACGLAGGHAFCWGMNLSGQLGTGVPDAGSTSAVPVSGGASYVSISVGDDPDGSGGAPGRTCALRTDGRAECWGMSFAAQPQLFGDSAFASFETSTWTACGRLGSGLGQCWNMYLQRIDHPDTLTFQELHPGEVICGIDGAGYAYCTDGRQESRPAGTELTFAHVGHGANYMCGLATDGRAYCWGGAADGGQLGDGTRTGRSSPTLVAGQE